jgi:hypothetical protein
MDNRPALRYDETANFSDLFEELPSYGLRGR